MAGDLPPSSKVTFFILLSSAALCTILPTAVDPVKLILATVMLEASRAPVLPGPLTKLMTPGGKPASLTRWPRARAERGDFSEDLKINCGEQMSEWIQGIEKGARTVFPAANAGAIFHPTNKRGPFQGAIPAQTPRGSWRTIL